MQNLVAFGYLLQWLGLLYAAEGRPGGDAAARALIAAAAHMPDPLPQPYNYMPGMAEAALSQNPHGCADIVSAALPLIRWFHVTDIRGHLDEGQVAHYQVTVKIGFTLSEESGEV